MKAGIIKPIDFSKCLSNPVVVAKPGGQWRVCIDFTDLNKSIPKKLYPLPHIDQLVDSMVGHEFFSFLDGYKGYDQIPMAEEDMAKTAFVTNDSIYCYIKMPFSLKYIGADLQEGMNKTFEGLVGVIVEIYVDDIIVKSRIRIQLWRIYDKCLKRSVKSK